MTTRRQVFGLTIALVATFAAAAIGGLGMGGEVEGWYRTLERPTWTPPSWLFGPVWTILYTLMAVAACLVWRRGGWGGARLALGLYVVQLALNAAWTPVFFGLHEVGWALVLLVTLWLMIVATTVAFFRKSTAAGALLVPYLAWTTFAGVLNGALWVLNA